MFKQCEVRDISLLLTQDWLEVQVRSLKESASEYISRKACSKPDDMRWPIDKQTRGLRVSLMVSLSSSSVLGSYQPDAWEPAILRGLPTSMMLYLRTGSSTSGTRRSR